MQHLPTQNFLKKMYDKLKDGERIFEVGNDISRDFLSIQEVTQAINYIINTENPETIYNISSGSDKKLKDCISEMAKQLKVSNISIVKNDKFCRKREPSSIIGDSSLLQKTGWKPTSTSTETLIKNFLKDI